MQPVLIAKAGSSLTSAACTFLSLTLSQVSRFPAQNYANSTLTFDLHLDGPIQPQIPPHSPLFSPPSASHSSSTAASPTPPSDAAWLSAYSGIECPAFSTTGNGTASRSSASAARDALDHVTVMQFIQNMRSHLVATATRRSPLRGLQPAEACAAGDTVHCDTVRALRSLDERWCHHFRLVARPRAVRHVATASLASDPSVPQMATEICVMHLCANVSVVNEKQLFNLQNIVSHPLQVPSLDTYVTIHNLVRDALINSTQ